MQYENISVLSLNLWRTRKIQEIEEFMAGIAPAAYRNKGIINARPEEGIWYFFEFDSAEERLSWEETLSSELRSWIDRGIIRQNFPESWHRPDPETAI